MKQLTHPVHFAGETPGDTMAKYNDITPFDAVHLMRNALIISCVHAATR